MVGVEVGVGVVVGIVVEVEVGVGVGVEVGIVVGIVVEVPMKIYLAGASREIDLCESFRNRLRASGHVITHDWMRDMRECPVKDHELTHEVRYMYAIDGMRGVLSANMVWVLCPDNQSVGCWVELGMALAIGAARIVVSGAWGRCIFADLAPNRFASHESALSWIVNESEKAA